MKQNKKTTDPDQAPVEGLDKVVPSTPTGLGLSELATKIKRKNFGLSDDDAEARAKEVKDADETLRNGRKGLAGKVQKTALNLIFGRGGNLRSIAGKLLKSKKDTVEASKIISKFKDDISGRGETSYGTTAALSKQISDELNELTDRVDDMNENVMDLITKTDGHSRVNLETLNKIANTVEYVRERVSPKDFTVSGKNKEEKATYRFDPLAPAGRQVKAISKTGKATVDVSKEGGATSAYERVISKASTSANAMLDKPLASRIPDKAVDEEIEKTEKVSAKPKRKDKIDNKLEKKIDKVLEILRDMRRRRGNWAKGEDKTREYKSRKKEKDSSFKSTDLIFGKKMGSRVRDLFKKKKTVAGDPVEKQKPSKGREILDKLMKSEKSPIARLIPKKENVTGLTPKLPEAVPAEGMAGAEAAGAAGKSIGGVGLAVAGGALIAGVAGHFINKGLKAVGMQDALDGNSFQKAGDKAASTDKFEASQAKMAGKLEGTGYTLVAPGKYKDATGNIVNRNSLPEDVQKKLPGGVMKGEDAGEVTVPVKREKFTGHKATSEVIAPEKKDIGAQVTPPKTETSSDGEKRSLIVSREKPVIINKSSGGGKQPVILITRNMEPSVSTYTASIFDHPVVHPGIYKM